MAKLLTALLGACLLALVFAPLGWLAYSVVAPEFHLPALTWWHFFLTTFAARSVFGSK